MKLKAILQGRFIGIDFFEWEKKLIYQLKLLIDMDSVSITIPEDKILDFEGISEFTFLTIQILITPLKSKSGFYVKYLGISNYLNKN